MAHVTLKLKRGKICKGVVRFETDEEDALFTNLYVRKDIAKKTLGLKDLEDVKAVEVTVRISK